MITIVDAILDLNPDAQVTVHGGDINKIVWADGETPISISDIELKQKELQAEYDSKKYTRERKLEYPNIGDQLDAVLKHLNNRRDEGDDLVEELDEVISAWLAVKLKYPKP